MKRIALAIPAIVLLAVLFKLVTATLPTPQPPPPPPPVPDGPVPRP